jgi:hypothetical protein
MVQINDCGFNEKFERLLQALPYATSYGIQELIVRNERSEAEPNRKMKMRQSPLHLRNPPPLQISGPKGATTCRSPAKATHDEILIKQIDVEQYD